MVGPRQEWRRKAETVSLLSCRLGVKAAGISLAMAVVHRMTRENGCASVAPFHSLTFMQQTQFKVANRIRGVLWNHLRCFLGRSANGLASREAMRSDLSAAVAERAAAVTTDKLSAYLMSPRSTVQTLLDDLVAAANFFECPLGPRPVGSRLTADAADTEDASGTGLQAGNLPHNGQRGRTEAADGPPAPPRMHLCFSMDKGEKGEHGQDLDWNCQLKLPSRLG